MLQPLYLLLEATARLAGQRLEPAAVAPEVAAVAAPEAEGYQLAVGGLHFAFIRSILLVVVSIDTLD